jgi:DNA-binding LacI/PurR family transcriptional regulator
MQPMPRKSAGESAERKSPTMADVAQRAGVSHQTVSRVLNGSATVREETRQRVLAAIDEMGYRRNNAARMLVTNRSGRIGMIASHLALYGPGGIAVAVQEAGHEAGYDVSLVVVSDFAPGPLHDAVDRLLDEAVEALVVEVVHRASLDAVRSLDLDIPIVVVQGVLPGQPMAVRIDQEAGAMLATEHLLGLGHRRVAHVSGPPDWVEATQRIAGWRLAHERVGRLPGPQLEGDWSARSGYRAGLAIAADTDVTAVFVANDEMALGLMKALHDRGRAVPAEISVVGFDDLPSSAFFLPALTTINQNFTRLGHEALRLALHALAGGEPLVLEAVEPELVVRGSTAPPQRP